MKAFIIFRDRVSYARRCLTALAAAGLEPVVVDHGSTFADAADWLADCERAGISVLYRGGGNPRGLWTWEPFRQACGAAERYLVTDPDCVPDEDCPAGWPQHLAAVLDAHPGKAGLGLRIDDIPGHYPRRAKVAEWEAAFWAEEITPGIYRATTDTTLALCSPLQEVPGHGVSGVRTGPPYLARHLPWYEDPAALPEDVRYYYDHAEPGICHWTIGGQPGVWD